MSGAFQERRRSPRVAVEGPCEFRFGRRVRVRLLDISASGALIASDEPLPLGAKGRLQFLFGAIPFETTVDVRREEPAGDGHGRVAGVAIATVDAAHQSTLEEFLRRAGV